jgi:hypothetical protein
MCLRVFFGTWGRDLSGSLDGAGGIGGLLAVHDPAAVPDPNDPNVMLPGDFIFFYDANGNVGQVVDLAFEPSDPNDPNTYTGAIKARYEYDPYGNSLLDVNDANQSGAYVAANPYRFSTKPWDDETGLGSWGSATTTHAWGGGLTMIRSKNSGVTISMPMCSMIRSGLWTLRGDCPWRAPGHGSRARNPARRRVARRRASTSSPRNSQSAKPRLKSSRVIAFLTVSCRVKRATN